MSRKDARSLSDFPRSGRVLRLLGVFPPFGRKRELLIYCYANGVFGSRRIETATYQNVTYDRAGQLIEELKQEVSGEWELVTVAYNMKRLGTLKGAPA